MIPPIKPIQVPDEYKLGEVLDDAQEELEKLTTERQRIDRRIAKLQGDIVHLSALCGVEVEDPIKQLGLTDAIRYIFGREERALSRQQVVEILEHSYDVSSYKNLAANVHTIVRRLLKSGQIKPVLNALLGKIGDPETYVWAKNSMPPPPPALPTTKREPVEVESSSVGRRIRKEFIKP